MKLIYRCEYCDFTGIEEEVLKHVVFIYLMIEDKPFKG